MSELKHLGWKSELWLYENGNRSFAAPARGFIPENLCLGAGITFLPTPSSGPAGKGRNICLCLVGLASPQPPPPLLFIAFHQHLEFEPARRWLAPAGGWSWGREGKEGGEGGREGTSPEPSPAACRGGCSIPAWS